MKLDSKHRLTSDDDNYILQRERAKHSKANEWQNIGYWGDLSQLLASYARQILRSKRGKTTFTAISRDLRTLTLAIERIGKQCVTLWRKD